jgi:hypothetical protein
LCRGVGGVLGSLGVLGIGCKVCDRSLAQFL